MGQYRGEWRQNGDIVSPENYSVLELVKKVTLRALFDSSIAPICRQPSGFPSFTVWEESEPNVDRLLPEC